VGLAALAASQELVLLAALAQALAASYLLATAANQSSLAGVATAGLGPVAAKVALVATAAVLSAR
jgi:hypothetical protein